MRLWEKGVSIDQQMHQLTVGDDPIFDTYLLPFDCLGTEAHASVLLQAKILSKDEHQKVLEALKRIFEKACRFEVPITSELEDCHTTLEMMLVKDLGDVGKKIHTGRSRNDQVIVTTRLFLRELIKDNLLALHVLQGAISKQYDAQKNVFLPGYTHLQPAMPSSVGMWWHALAEALHELQVEGVQLYRSVNKNPLGAAAGFGSGLPLDRTVSAQHLGFDSVQRSFIDIQNSRGRYEEKYLQWLSAIGSVAEKFAADVSLFTTKEFGFVTLPPEFTTGSSIMPQKRNPDVIELTRGRAAGLKGFVSQIQWVTGKLPSNYHRDLQLSKAPFFEGARQGQYLMQMLNLVVPVITFNEPQMNTRKDAELYATYEAYRLVKEGVPFREAYQKIANDLSKDIFVAADTSEQYEQVLNETDQGMQSLKVDLTQIEKDISSLNGFAYKNHSTRPTVDLTLKNYR